MINLKVLAQLLPLGLLVHNLAPDLLLAPIALQYVPLVLVILQLHEYLDRSLYVADQHRAADGRVFHLDPFLLQLYRIVNIDLFVLSDFDAEVQVNQFTSNFLQVFTLVVTLGLLGTRLAHLLVAGVCFAVEWSLV